jgi:hypothetical protein
MMVNIMIDKYIIFRNDEGRDDDHVDDEKWVEDGLRDDVYFDVNEYD